MARVWCVVVVAAMLLAAVPPVASAIDVDDDIFWFAFEDEEGDESDDCLLTTDGSRPTPCDILEFAMGNTDTHVYVRWTLATLSFGTTGTFAFVEYQNSFRGTHGELSQAIFDVNFRLYSDGSLEFEEKPDGWDMELDEGPGAGQIIYSISLDDAVTTLESDEVVPLVEFMNVTRVRSRVNPVGELAAMGDLDSNSLLLRAGDSLAIPVEQRSYVFQPYGSLEAPVSGPVPIFADVEGDELNVQMSFEEQTSAIYVYNWSMGLERLRITLDADITNGTLLLELVSPDNQTMIEETFTPAEGAESEDADPVEFGQTLDSVAPGDWTVTLTLDDFIGSFHATGGQAPSPDDDDYDPTEEGGPDGDADGNETDDPGVDDDGRGLPAPGVVLVLAALAALLAYRRRRQASD